MIFQNIAIIASTSGKFFAINKKNGNLIWEQYLNTSQTPLVNGNSIFLTHNNKELINLDLKNGKIRWSTEISQDISEEKSNLWLTPVLMNSKLVLVGGNKKLVIVNPFSGEIEAELRLPDIPITSPIVVNKKIFLMFKNSSIFSIE